jgi:carbon monoxide dehydrogenase subunit G
MKLEQSFEVMAPVDRVWRALIDVEHVAPLLPGVSITGRNDDGSYRGLFTVKLGPTSAAYAGTLTIDSLNEQVRVASLHAYGHDRRGQGTAKATIFSTCSAMPGGGTRVEVITEYFITGLLARFGRGGMIEDIAERLLREFAQRLQESLGGGAPPAPDGAAPEEADAAAEPEVGAPAGVAAPAPVEAAEADALTYAAEVASYRESEAWEEPPAPPVAERDFDKLAPWERIVAEAMRALQEEAPEPEREPEPEVDEAEPELSGVPAADAPSEPRWPAAVMPWDVAADHEAVESHWSVADGEAPAGPIAPPAAGVAPEPEPEAKLEPEPEAKLEPEPEVKLEPEPEPEPDAELEPKPERGPAPEPEPEPVVAEAPPAPEPEPVVAEAPPAPEPAMAAAPTPPEPPAPALASAPPPPPAPEPAAPSPPAPPNGPLPAPTEPIEAMSLVGSVLWGQVRRNPGPAGFLAGVVVTLFARRRGR